MTEAAALSPRERAVALLTGALPAQGGGTLQERRDGYEAALAQLPIPEGVSVAAGVFGGVAGFWATPQDAPAERIGVMLHGGGYYIGSAKGYRAYAAAVARATGARVFAAEYRLAPEHPFPAGVEDASSVLSAAIEEVGPESCFAIGDSAGGGLLLSALLDLHRVREPLPSSIVLVSPLVDLTVSNPSYDERAASDPMVSKKGIERAAELYLGGRGPDEAPGAFPMLAELGWLPPCLLLVGTAEVLLDDSRNLAAKLEREGAPVEFHEYEGMVHVWPLFSSFMPEGQQALDQIGAFVDRQMPTPSPS